MFGPLKSLICMKECEKENAVSHKSFWLIFGVNSHLFHYFIVSWWCCLCYDRWWQAAARSITAYIYCTLWFGCCFFPDSFFFSFFHEFWKAVNFILRHCTVDQSCKYFTSTKKEPNNMFCSFTNKKFSSILTVICGNFVLQQLGLLQLIFFPLFT